MKNFTIRLILLFIAGIGYLGIGYGQASLPVSRTAWGTTPTGWTDNGVVNRITNFACSGDDGGSIQTSGRYYRVNFNAEPDKLSYELRGSYPTPSNSTGDFRVQESSDGTSWTDVQAFSTIIGSSCQSQSNLQLLSTSRYVQFIYILKTAGNVDIDDVIITALGSANYFRSQASGSWNTAANWETSATGANPWTVAPAAPTSSATAISIRNGHSISINSVGVSMKATTVETGGTLSVATLSPYTLAGAGNQLFVNSGGNFLVNVAGTIPAVTNFPTATGLIRTGGKLIAGPAITTGTSFGDNYLNTASGLFYFENNGVCEWQNSSTILPSSGAGNNYFAPVNATAIPVLRFTTTPGFPFGSDTNNFFDCKLEVISPATFSTTGSGTKTFSGGIGGTNGVISQASSSTGAFVLDHPFLTPVLEGSITLNVFNDGLEFSNGLTVPATANVKIQSSLAYARIKKIGATSLMVNGVLDVTNLQILNASGSVIVNGTIKTSNADGFYANGAFPNATIKNPGTYFINTNSTIEYNGASQAISTAPTYYNITLSGTGTKTPSSTGNVTINDAGTVTISGTTNADLSTSNLGPSSTSNSAGLVMNGTGILKFGLTGSGRALPWMDGTYNITAGTVQYDGNGQTIRGKTYQNILVTGTDVGNSNSNISLNSAGGDFTVSGPTAKYTSSSIAINSSATSNSSTVKVINGGTWECNSSEGFSGFSTLAAPNRNSSIHQDIAASRITLDPGTFIIYNRTSNQNISNHKAYQNLTISGNGIKTASSGTITVGQNLVKAGTSTFVHNSGKMLVNGAANYNVAGLSFYDLELTGATKTLTANASIENTLHVTANTNFALAPASMLTLKSALGKTASLMPITGTSNISYGVGSSFEIERYLRGAKSWRLLATPVKPTPSTGTPATIKASWQEGKVSMASTGYGTLITGPTATGTDLDENTQRGSMKWFDAGVQNYVEITNTNNPIARKEGYYVFVRGDRAATVALGTGTPTNLRIKGEIITGTQIFSAPTNAYASVGNPYPSRISFKDAGKTVGLVETFTVWNPLMSGTYGVGAFQSYVKETGGTGDYRLNGTGAVLNHIESGQAFFVLGSPSSGGQLTINEANKLSGSADVSRVTSNDRGNSTTPTLELRLLRKDNNGDWEISDAALINYGKNYSNSIDREDVMKFYNSADNISINSNGKTLTVERRNMLIATDSIKISLYGMRTADYQLDLTPVLLSSTGLKAVVIDKFLDTRTPVQLNNNLVLAFSCTNEAASRAADRFYIVFKKAPLPFKFTRIDAQQQNGTAQVSFSVANEDNVLQYQLQISKDGNSFLDAGTSTTVNAAFAGNYKISQNTISKGENWYRIVATFGDSTAMVSDIVKLIFSQSEPFFISPNPITSNGLINVSFLERAEGAYTITFVSNAGQVLFVKQIRHAGGTCSYSISPQENFASGVYYVKVKAETGAYTTIKIVRE